VREGGIQKFLNFVYCANREERHETCQQIEFLDASSWLRATARIIIFVY